MTIKALMVDVDGVLVHGPAPGLRWDHAIETDLGIRAEDLQKRFFEPHFREVVLGRAALEDRLAIALPTFAPHLTSEQLMAYWFEKDSRLDQVLLDDLAGLRAGGLALHLATIQEHRRADYLWETLGLKHRFDGLHHSAAVGYAKPDLAYFRSVEARTGFAPADLMLIDDSLRNVEGARDAGWAAALWTGQARLADLLP